MNFFMNTSSSIQIYTGTGSSPLCSQGWKREIADLVDPRYYKIDEFNAGYDTGLDRENIALVIIPGGNAYEMEPSITLLSAKIQEAVNRRKASLIGSCAGTILCSPNGIDHKTREVDFTSNSHLTLNPLEIQFPYYLPHSPSFKDPENKSAIEVEWLPSYGNYSSQRCSLYHAFGPAFPMQKVPLRERFNVRPLAMYKTQGNISQLEEPAAAILYHPPAHNASTRLFTGIHPEISIKDLSSPLFHKQFNDSNQSHIVHLKNQLEGSEQIRKEMIRSWLSELGLKILS